MKHMPTRFGLDSRKTYFCEECGEEKTGSYFITKHLCKKCAAKRRTNSLVWVSRPSKPANEPDQGLQVSGATAADPRKSQPEQVLEPNRFTQVTDNVYKRLRKQADAETPRQLTYRIALVVPVLSMMGFFAVVGFLFKFWGIGGGWVLLLTIPPINKRLRVGHPTKPVIVGSVQHFS